MIRKEPKHPGYGKYFLASEAPGDNLPLRRNMKVITVNPSRRARLDFTNDLVVPDEPEPELPEMDDSLDLDLPDIDDGDTSVGDLPEIDDDNVSDLDLPDLNLPDVDDTRTQNDPAQDMELPDPPELDLPENPSGSSVDDLDLPEIDDPVPDIPDTNLDLPELDNDEPDMELDLPDVPGEDDIPNTVIELPHIDDDVQSTNIQVNPGDNDGDNTDYTDTNDEVQSTNIQVNPDDSGDGTDFAADPNTLDLPPTDGTDPGTDPTTNTDNNADNTDYTQQGDGGNDTGTVDASPAPDGGGDDVDFTQTGDDTGSNAQSPTEGDTNQVNDDNQKRGPGLEYDSVRKYNLYKEFARLRTAIDSYISKLESCISDDPESNHVIKICTTKFREMYDLITDYMMMKFELCTYIQNLLFYQRQIATVHLIFTLLQEANKGQKSEKEKNKR